MGKYNSYKDSGIEWLGEIPSHWEIKHLRNFLSIYSQKGHADKQLLSVTRENGIIIRNAESNEDNHNFVPDDLSGYKYVSCGDFVINKMKSWQGSYGVSKYEGIVSPAYYVCSLEFPNKDFFNIAIRSKAYIPFFLKYSKGIRVDQWDLSTDALKEIPFIKPLKEEQNKIVLFLERQTAKIDKAIAQKQRMIDLLNERKRIIIQYAVTKGLNENVGMKDSNVDWIGEIPAHWDIKKLRSIGTTINGVSHNSSYFGSGFPFVSYSDVYKNSSLPKHIKGLANSTSLEQTVFSVEEGDVFFTRTSETAEEIGFSSVCMDTIDKAVFAGFLIRFRPNKGILDKKYSKYFFRANMLRNYFVKEMNLVTRASLSQGLLKGLPIIIPPMQEQKGIALYLDKVTGKIDQAIEHHHQMLTLLQERKQIIISEVVTGKIKVS
ncbi:restriction endonuclease subunit S [Bacteroides fluxus]